jgi:hypothetical protein
MERTSSSGCGSALLVQDTKVVKFWVAHALRIGFHAELLAQTLLCTTTGLALGSPVYVGWLLQLSPPMVLLQSVAWHATFH